MKEIKLFNRDGADLRLVNHDINLWKLQVDDHHKYVLDYMRIGYENDNITISFVDPSGGPYLCRGQRLNKKYIINLIAEVDGEFIFHLVEENL